MSGRKLAIALSLLALLLAGWRWQAVGRRAEANAAATFAERTLAQALQRFGGALPRRFLEDNLALLERARKTDPASVEAAVSLAGYLFMLRRFDEAEKVYLEALKLEKRSEIYANLARLYLQENRPEDAIAPLQQAIRIDPQMENQLRPMLENALRAAAAKEEAEKAKAAGLPTPEPNEQAIFGDNFESGRLDRWNAVELGQQA